MAGIIIGLPILITLLLYVPPIQNFVVHKACEMASRSTGMDISVNRILLKFPLKLNVDGVKVMYAEGDTMAVAGHAEANLSFRELLVGDLAVNDIVADSVFYQMGTRDSVMWLRANAHHADIDYGRIDLTFSKIDVNKARLRGGNVFLAMKDTITPAPVDTAASKPVRVRAALVTLEDINYKMLMPPTIDTLQAYVAHATLKEGLVDTGKRLVNAKHLAIDGVKARYIYPATPSATPADSIAETSSDLWTVTADSLSVSAKEALYAARGTRPIPGLDMNYLEARDINILVTNFYNRGVTVKVPLQRLTGSERSGLNITASGLFEMDSVMMKASDFNLRTNHSQVAFDAMLGVGNPMTDTKLPIQIKAKGNVAGADIGMAMPAYAPMVKALPSPADVTFDVNAAGTTRLMKIQHFNAALPGVANVKVNGYVTNLNLPEKTGGKVTVDGAVKDPNAVKRSLAQLKMDPGINIPALTLHADVDYKPGNVNGKMNLITQGGKMLASGCWNARKEGYSANVSMSSFPVNAFMPSLGVGRVTGTLTADGSGYNPLRPGTRMNTDVHLSSIALNDRTLVNTSLKAQIIDSYAEGYLTSANPGADLDVQFKARLDSGYYRGDVTGDIRDLNLHTLGLSETPNGGHMTLKGHGSFNPSTNSITADLNLSDLNWLVDTLDVTAPEISLRATADRKLTTLHLNNEDLEANAAFWLPYDSIMPSMDRFTAVMQRQIKDRRADIRALQAVMPRFDLILNMGKENVVQRYLNKYMNASVSNMSFTAHNDSLIHMALFANDIDYDGTVIKDINLNANQHDKFLVYSGTMHNGPGKLAEWATVDVRGFIADDKFGAYGTQKNPAGEQGYRLGVTATMADSTVTMRFGPENPTIAYRMWALNDDNFLSYNLYTKKIEADITLANESSSLQVYTRPMAVEEGEPKQDELVISAKDVKIEDWVAMSPFAPPIAGTASADIKMHRENNKLMGTATVNIADLMYNHEKVGDIGVNLKVANNPRTMSLWADGDMIVNGKKVMTLNGALNDSTQSNPFLLDMSVIHFPLDVANPFLPPHVAKLNGTINGTMKVSGDAATPVFDGFLQFDSATVKVLSLGSTFTFSEEKIPVTNNLVKFNNFTINSLNENPFVINGTADLTNLSDIGMNLNLNGRDMLVVNSSRPRGADIYGKGYVDFNAMARGNLSRLFVNADVALVSGSQITYVMSDANEVISSQGTGEMVKFVNFNDSLAATTDSVAQTMNLYMLATLSLEDNTTINVDLSPDGKNRASVMATGSLDFSMNPENTGRLSGRLTINSGYVRYSPPLLGEKNFKFNEGSWINFTGDMMNPTFSISAVDQLKANVTGEDGGNGRLVNFAVTVTATGTFNNMNVAFDLACDDDITVQNELQSMSADQRANQAINLLLYNSYTGAGTKTASGFNVGNPLYSMLASQLNNLAASYVKGVDLSFGINQFNNSVDKSNATTATSYSYQLSKSLLNNRIRIVLGGNFTDDNSTTSTDDSNVVADLLINDISFEYLLNRSGSMYVRLYRKKSNENIVEGEITATGVGFVYKRNLNSLKNIFRFKHRQSAAKFMPKLDSSDSIPVHQSADSRATSTESTSLPAKSPEQ